MVGAFDPKSRARAAGVHMALSMAVAALAACLVFLVWYPTPYREISGGRDLFLILVAVDVVIGPLITFAVFDRRKPRAELVRDLGVVAMLQLGALGYGLFTMAQARPAVIALEGDRLRVVRAIDLADTDLGRAPEGFKQMSWLGPQFLAARAPTRDERLDAIDKSLSGRDIGMRPEFWRAPSETGRAYAGAAKPIDDLLRLQPESAARVAQAVSATGRRADELGFLPLLARDTTWSALVDRQTGAVVGYVNVEGF